MEGGHGNNGDNVQQWEDNGSDAQRWTFEYADNGVFHIRSLLGTYLNVAGAKTDNGTNIQTYEFDGSVAERFKLEPVTP